MLVYEQRNRDANYASLNPKEQQELNSRMEKKQMREFMTVWQRSRI